MAPADARMPASIPPRSPVTAAKDSPATRPVLAPGRLAAKLHLQALERRVQVADRVVAALGVARIGERMGLQAAHATLEDDEVNVLDEVPRGCAAVAANPGEIARLDGFDDRLEVGGAEPVNSVGIDHRAVGEDLEEHAELAAVIRAAQGHSGQERVGLRHGTACARAGRQALARDTRGARGWGTGVWFVSPPEFDPVAGRYGETDWLPLAAKLEDHRTAFGRRR